MTRKAFIADVTSASEKSIPSVLDVERGEDDGDVNFVFLPMSGVPINIALLALGTSLQNHPDNCARLECINCALDLVYQPYNEYRYLVL